MKMSSLKSWYSALAVISFTGWCTADLARKPLDRPNILLFLADDMGYVRDGFVQHKFLKSTVAVDKMMKRKKKLLTVIVKVNTLLKCLEIQ